MKHTALTRTLALAAALLAVAAAFVTAPSPAAAGAPCWKQLLDDWVIDGRIDKRYRVTCYREALDRLPAEAEDYTSAYEDIQRALQDAIRQNNDREPQFVDPPKNQGPADPLAPLAIGGGGGGSSGGGNDSGGSLDVLLPRANGADSVPLPLLILAGLALFLLAAAGAAFATRRVQARRVRVHPLPDDHPHV